MTTDATPWETLIGKFLDSLKLDRGSSQHTIRSYRLDLGQFQGWLPQNVPPGRVSARQIELFLEDLSKNGHRASSVSRKASAIRQFFRFCCLEEGFEQNPSERIKSPSLPSRLPKSLSIEETTRLLQAAEKGLPYRGGEGEFLRARDRSMVFLLYATGLRVSELIGLQFKQLDLHQGIVRVLGKGQKERIVPFAPIAAEYLKPYLENERPKIRQADPAHVFIGRRGEAITRQNFWRTLKQLGKLAGLKAALSPHVLRHSFATHLLESGMNLRSLQLLLGHADLSTTQIYTHISPSHLKKAHQKFHPRGG